jgi:hypothetical protein
MTITNSPNKVIRQKKVYWDSKINEIKTLVVIQGYRMKQLALHFDCKESAILAILKHRGISVILLRHRHAKGEDVFND